MGFVKKLTLFNNSDPQLSTCSQTSSNSKKDIKLNGNSKYSNSSGTTTTITTSSNNAATSSHSKIDVSSNKESEIIEKQPHTSSTIHSATDLDFNTPEEARSLKSVSDVKSITSQHKKEEHHNHSFSHLLHKLAPHSTPPSPHNDIDSPTSKNNHHNHHLQISLQQQQHELQLIKEHNKNLYKMLGTRDKVFGIENFGNTCYMNSIIQCLFVLDGFRNKLMEAHLVKEIHLSKKNYMALKPRQFTHNSLTNNGQKNKNKNNGIKVVNIDSVLHNLGIKIPADRVVVGGCSDNKVHSNDTRKKNALLKGPVINVDHLSLNYQAIEKDLDKDDSKRLYYALKDLFEIIIENDSSTGVVSPTDLLSTLKTTNMLFQGGMHQDSQEFLNFLLNSMNDHLENLQKQEDIITTENNFIKDYFQGCLTNNIKCLKCNTVSKTYEPFFDIQIPVSKKFKNISNAFNNLIESPAKEILKGSNKFFCEKCGELQKAERVVQISKLPKFLILHLKRYEYSEKENKMVKLFNKMEYSLLLRNDTLKKKYELSGIVVHLGLDSSHGHYISIVKNEKLGWLIYDDETVMAIQEQDVLKFYGNVENMSCAYLLFYKELEKEFTGEPTNSADSSGSSSTESRSSSAVSNADSTAAAASSSSFSKSRRGSLIPLKKETISPKQKEYNLALKQFIEKDEIFRLKHRSLSNIGLDELESEIKTPPVTPNASGTKLNFLLSSNPMNKQRPSSTNNSNGNQTSGTQVSSAGSETNDGNIKRSKSKFWRRIRE